ncbi:MerR family transcriptional regulator [Planctomonas sp. JC2975]|uniref:MerR family transcriptional regulator n=1 Tax=Planctomonas sp. JC2975 TaxID=2729626 RepID=UPI001474AF54|nr:MerR family transcriptional regulator [Planctomonas sp. JC2975]NNC12197.1 MerR family transcriptional regulator [Planctomonas sp. JC2975]
MTDDTDAEPLAERSIQDLARLVGTTSRTLRHYDDIGLLKPSRIGANGYRYYDERAFVRLQRILLLRDLGLGLADIAAVLGREQDETVALRHHLHWLKSEQDRLARQAASVASTIDALQKGEAIMAENAFDGFDHTQYKEEVEERWGSQAYAKSDAWWRSKSETEKREFQQQHLDIAADYASAKAEGADPADDRVQQIVQRHVDWLNLAAPATGVTMGREVLLGYGDMYVADERFAANYGGTEGATFVRDAFRVYADRQL